MPAAAARKPMPGMTTVPKIVEAMFARPETAAARPSGTASRFLRTYASMPMIGIRSSHEYTTKLANKGTPTFAWLSVGKAQIKTRR